MCLNNTQTIDSLFQPAACVPVPESCTGLILQTRNRPYPQYLKPHLTRVLTVARITFRPDQLLIDIDARPAPKGKLEPLDGTPGNYTMWCLAWSFRLLCKKSTSSTGDGFSGLLRSCKTYPAPEKSCLQSQNPRPTCAVQVTGVQPAPDTLFLTRFIQIVRVSRQVPVPGQDFMCHKGRRLLMHSQWRGERTERRRSVLRHNKRANSHETVASV